MNYYERHLGDYAKDTGHLSMLEHGAYTLLMDRYYGAELPISDEDKYRQARARTDEERTAVDAVLKEFFTLRDGAWVKGRIDEEIARYQDGEPQRLAKLEHERDRQRRSRDRRKQLFDQLREHGEVPAYDTPMNELVTLLSRVTSRVTPRVQPNDVTATQTPDTKHQTPEEKKKTPAARVTKLVLSAEDMLADNPDLSLEQAAEYLAYRGAKKAPLTASAWRSIVGQVRKTGRPLPDALAYAQGRGWVGFELSWLRQDSGGSKPSSNTDRAQAAHAELDRMIDGVNGTPPHGNEPPPDDFIDVPARDVG